MLVYLKVHETKDGRIVAACDRNLLGKVLDDGKARLDLKMYRGFYEGELAEAKALEAALGRFSSANLVGKTAVGVAMGLGMASKDDVRYIKSIPYVQIYRF